MAWLNGDAPSSAFGLPLTAQDMSEVTATGTASGQAEATPSASVPPVVDSQEGSIGEVPEEDTAEDVFLRGQRVLLDRGEVVVEFGQFYSRSDDRQLTSVDDRVGLATVEQDTFTTLLLGRVGLRDDTELFASTTFRSQHNDVFLGSTSLTRSGRTEFGDVGVGVRHTLLQEGVGRPDIIATLDGHIPTGDTSYAIGGGLVLVKQTS